MSSSRSVSPRPLKRVRKDDEPTDRPLTPSFSSIRGRGVSSGGGGFESVLGPSQPLYCTPARPAQKAPSSCPIDYLAGLPPSHLENTCCESTAAITFRAFLNAFGGLRSVQDYTEGVGAPAARASFETWVLHIREAISHGKPCVYYLHTLPDHHWVVEVVEEEGRFGLRVFQSFACEYSLAQWLGLHGPPVTYRTNLDAIERYGLQEILMNFSCEQYILDLSNVMDCFFYKEWTEQGRTSLKRVFGSEIFCDHDFLEEHSFGFQVYERLPFKK